MAFLNTTIPKSGFSEKWLSLEWRGGAQGAFFANFFFPQQKRGWLILTRGEAVGEDEGGGGVPEGGCHNTLISKDTTLNTGSQRIAPTWEMDTQG